LNKIYFIIISFVVILFTACSGTVQAPKSVSNPYKGKYVSAYLIGEYESVASVKEKLTSASFEVLAKYSPVSRVRLSSLQTQHLRLKL